MCKTFRQLWLAMLTIGLFSSPALAESAPNPALLNQLALEAPALQKDALTKAIAAMTCAVNSGMEPADRLAVIDFSLPSSEPRLWIFDLRDQTLLLEDFVAHGQNSGTITPRAFPTSWAVTSRVSGSSAPRRVTTDGMAIPCEWMGWSRVSTTGRASARS
jgi:hypothetical protein